MRDARSHPRPVSGGYHPRQRRRNGIGPSSPPLPPGRPRRRRSVQSRPTRRPRPRTRAAPLPSFTTTTRSSRPRRRAWPRRASSCAEPSRSSSSAASPCSESTPPIDVGMRAACRVTREDGLGFLCLVTRHAARGTNPDQQEGWSLSLAPEEGGSTETAGQTASPSKRG